MFALLCAAGAYFSWSHFFQSRDPGAQMGQLEKRTKVIMGTYATMTYPLEYEKAVVEAFGRIEELEALLSTYREDSQVSRLNREDSLDKAHPDLLRLLNRSLELSRKTDGYFDVTVGTLVEDVYHMDDEEERIRWQKVGQPPPPPKPNDLNQALARVGYKSVHIEGDRIYFANQDGKIDFGGIGKGFAIDEAAKVLRGRGMERGRLALSGDIRCMGRCSVAIENPHHLDVPLATFRSRKGNLSVSTSGGYGRYMGTPKVNHLVDPYTGLSSVDLISVTLVTWGDNTLVDGLATAVAVMPWLKVEPILSQFENVGYIVFPIDGKPVVSVNFQEFAEDLVFPPKPD
ncbi:MAG: FAD:protein FMN transferase [Bdellovibrionales bacterium]|nr:FAD:protein FMN transferase [Bdellovibrionales bacterium]